MSRKQKILGNDFPRLFALMLGFGTFVVTLIALIVELIKNQRKK